MNYTLRATSRLTAVDVACIRDLIQSLGTQKGVHYKLDADALTEGTHEHRLHLLAEENGVLVGYVALACFDPAEFEATLVVPDDPALLTLLFTGAQRTAAERGAEKLLYIADRRDAFVAAWLRDSGAAYEFTEIRLALDEAKFVPTLMAGLTLRPATEADRPLIAALDADGFGEGVSSAAAAAIPAADLAATQIAMLAGEAVGKLRVDQNGGTLAIYGFVVSPDRRGQGLGRRVLSQAIADMLCQPHDIIYLEVAEDNAAARRLYESLGFAAQAVFDYYALKP